MPGGDPADVEPDWDDDEPDPDRLVGCEYWRCDEIFEQRTANHRFCRKACRSRHNKWERSQERKRAREAARAERVARRRAGQSGHGQSGQ